MLGVRTGSTGCLLESNCPTLSSNSAHGIGFPGSVQDDIWFSFQFAAPAPNDNFANATVVPGMPFSESVDAAGATTETGEPTGGCNPSNQTIWYVYTATTNGVVSPYVYGQYHSYQVRNAYQATESGLGGLSFINCAVYGGSLNVAVQTGNTYYFQIGTIESNPGILTVSFEFTPAPANDNFADAKVVTTLPYDDSIDYAGATRETNEPSPSCGYMNKTAWYAYTPSESGSVSQRADTYWPSSVVAVYTGSSLNSLQEAACRYPYSGSNLLTFHVDAGTTYYFQVGTNDNAWVPFRLEVAPPPVANFGYNPSDPNMFDTVYFDNYSWDPANTDINLMTRIWDFGDGTTITVIPPTNEPWSPSHRYAADGDYTVKLTVTTIDGRTASMTKTIPVKTHDVTIAKFSVPQSAKVGQTRQIAVGISNKRYPEEVEVQLYKSYAGGWQWVGSLRQSVPVRSGNRTTEFSFNYTFTAEDGALGKVTFRAVATLINARDALPADNEAIALPTKVLK